MVRKENWPSALSTFLKEREKMPFSWGDNDCLTFVFRAVERLTGEDLRKQYPTLASEEEADIIVNENGGIKVMLQKNFGEGSHRIIRASRGDIVLVKTPLPTAGIVDDTGENIAVMGRDGLVRIPLKKALRFWRY